MRKFCYQQRSRVTGDMFQLGIEAESLKRAALQIGHIFPESRKGGIGTESSPALFASREYATRIWEVSEENFRIVNRQEGERAASLFWEARPWTPAQIEE